MAASSSISTSSATDQYSLEFGAQQPRRTRSHSRARDDETTANSNSSSEYTTNNTHSPDISLLAYASPSLSLADFPMPPKALHIQPHPHAPPALSSGGLLPAIYRRPQSQHYNASATDTKTLTNTLAEAAVVGQQKGKSNTIHGRTSFDLLSATGPVPIHFALGGPMAATTLSPTINPPQERNPSNSVSGCNSPGDAPSSSPFTEGDTCRNRRSFSDIVSAIETPSSFPIGRPPLDPSAPNLHTPPSSTNSQSGKDRISVPVTEGSSVLSTGLLPPDSINTSPQHGRNSPVPEVSNRAPRKLSKSLPSNNYRAHPPMPLTLDHQNASSIPKIPIVAPSSMPSSPLTIVPPLPNGRLHGTKSIPNLRSVPGVERLHRPGTSGPRNARRDSSSSVSISDDVAPYHAGILESYGVELSPNWDTPRYHNQGHLGSHTPSPTTTQILSNPATTLSSGGVPSPRLAPERVRPSPQQRVGGTASIAPQDASPLVNTVTNSPSVSRALSLRHKISISAMRGNAATARRMQDSAAAEREQAVPRLRDKRLPNEETVEVDDMEFTLVKPEIFRNGSPIPPSRDSEDRPVGSETASSSREPATARSRTPSASQGQTLYVHVPGPASPSLDSSSSAPQTPLLSPFSASFPPSMDSHASLPASEISQVGSRGSSTDSAIASANAENHRQLEVKWINAMSSVPSAEAGKSKKIRRLVIGGIPASVRGVVWLYLTDKKGRRMPGVYDQLRQRRTDVSDAIWTDIKSRFPDQPHLCAPEGSVMSILQAYLSMVPDTSYSYGLAIIAGNLLLQTHEEDSFWTFVALMDRHLRGYFSPTAKLLEIDSLLFERAVGTSDKALARRLFDDLRVNATSFCGHWFTTLFACALPPAFVPRIWDSIMYFADATFLFRLGLAVLKLCRPFIMDAARCRCAEDAIPFLIKPPTNVLPTYPDAIISSALAVKFNEDDLRKLRPKIEAQLKQRHLSRLTPIIR